MTSPIPRPEDIEARLDQIKAEAVILRAQLKLSRRAWAGKAEDTRLLDRIEDGQPAISPDIAQLPECPESDEPAPPAGQDGDGADPEPSELPLPPWADLEGSPRYAYPEGRHV